MYTDRYLKGWDYLMVYESRGGYKIDAIYKIISNLILYFKPCEFSTNDSSVLLVTRSQHKI